MASLWITIACLGGGTLALRLAGPLARNRIRLPERAERLAPAAAVVLLFALAITGALTQRHGFAGWARPAGVLTAGVLALRRAPFPVVVLAAATVTALLRLCGIA